MSVRQSAEDVTFGAATSIAAAAATVPLGEAAALLAAEYGIAGEVSRLIGERDQNFAVRQPDGARHVLKLIHPAEDPAVTNFQTALLLHLEAASPGLPVQRVVRTLSGGAEKRVGLADGGSRMMRLTTFLPGTIIRGLPPSRARSTNLGRVLAQLQTALAGFAHPADRHEIAWDIRHTARQRAVADEIGTQEQRAAMRAGLARFEERALPAMASLRAQVVHNDLSGDNVVVDPADHDRIAGVLDFGDATRTAVVNDVAIGATYVVTDAADFLDGPLALVAGFHSVKPLLQEEIDLLPDLMIARMVVRVGITEWRARRFPDNKDYILRNTPAAWRALDRLLLLDPDRTRAAFHQACVTE